MKVGPLPTLPGSPVTYFTNTVRQYARNASALHHYVRARVLGMEGTAPVPRMQTLLRYMLFIDQLYNQFSALLQ